MFTTPDSPKATPARLPETCPSPHRGISARRGAFTLLELLVVVAIIALLVGMLMPAIGLVRSGAKSAVCQSRYRQMAVVFDNYLSNNDQMFPDAQNPNANYAGYHYFIDLLLETRVKATNEYAKIFMCGEDPFRPTDIVPVGRWGNGGTVWDKDGQSHGYNCWGIGGSGGNWGTTHKMANCATRNEIKYPEATILSTCTLQTGADHKSNYLGNGYGYSQGIPGYVYPRHRGNTVVNVLWVDYHVSGVQAAGPDDTASLFDPLRLGVAPPYIKPSAWDRD